jgi:hypothetical protein
VGGQLFRITAAAANGPKVTGIGENDARLIDGQPSVQRSLRRLR